MVTVTCCYSNSNNDLPYSIKVYNYSRHLADIRNLICKNLNQIIFSQTFKYTKLILFLTLAKWKNISERFWSCLSKKRQKLFPCRISVQFLGRKSLKRSVSNTLICSWLYISTDLFSSLTYVLYSVISFFEENLSTVIIRFIFLYILFL